MKVFIAITFLLIVLFSCNSGDKRKRPDNVPSSTFWAGGVDGGNWYMLDNVDNTSKTALIRVYNDYTGELILNKSFHLVCNTNMMLSDRAIETDITAFDGQRIPK